MYRVEGKPLQSRIAPTMVMFRSDSKATIVDISIALGNTHYVATGSSWRNSGDTYDEHSGNIIALSRAIEELKDILKTEAEKITKHD
jgi:hypothetical protein